VVRRLLKTDLRTADRIDRGETFELHDCAALAVMHCEVGECAADVESDTEATND
jgi:hypothetical protein